MNVHQIKETKLQRNQGSEMIPAFRTKDKEQQYEELKAYQQILEAKIANVNSNLPAAEAIET